VSTPSELRREAQRCRRLARSISDAKATAALLGLASDYEKKAELLQKDRHAARDESPRVEAVDGEVAIIGPARLAGSLTPGAARSTGANLIEVAEQAEAVAQTDAAFGPGLKLNDP